MESIWITMFVCFACYSYNKSSVSFVIPKLLEGGLDRSHAGLIMSCQNGAMTLSKFLVGLLSDRTDPRRVFTYGLMFTAATTLLFSCVPISSLTLMCGLWFLNGVAQGCGWTMCAKIIRQKASPSEFGVVWSVLSSAKNFMGTVSPFVSSYIVLLYGWRASVFTAGLVSMFFGIVSAFTLRLSEENEKKPNSENFTKKAEREATEVGLFDLLSDPFLIMVCIGYSILFCTKSALTDWGQLYLIEECGRSIYEGSVFISSIESGGLLGKIGAGYITDRLIKPFTTKGYSASSVRLTVSVFFLLGNVCLLHALQVTVTEKSTTLWIIYLGFLLGATLYGPVVIFGIVSTESFPAHLSGRSYAIASLAANLGSIVSGFPCCFIAKHYSWSTVFFLIEIATCIILTVIFCLRNLRPKILRHKKVE